MWEDLSAIPQGSYKLQPQSNSLGRGSWLILRPQKWNNPDGTLFVIEDLTGIRSVTENVKVKDRYVSVSWSYYDLEQKLSYKALKHQQLVEKVNPAYTSQTCPKCGHTEKTNRNKKIHLFCCKNCAYKSNDDRIGAMNLHRMGIELLVPDAVATE